MLVTLNTFKTSSILLTLPRQCFVCGSFCYLCFVFVLSVPCSNVITCCERSLVCDVSCDLSLFHMMSWVGCGVLDCIKPDLCLLP